MLFRAVEQTGGLWTSISLDAEGGEMSESHRSLGVNHGGSWKRLTTSPALFGKEEERVTGMMWM